MRRQIEENNNYREENPFSMSVGDLMAAIMLIFVLLLSGTLLQVIEKNKTIDEIVQTYDSKKQTIVIGLKTEFGDYFNDWGASVNDSTLSVCFQTGEAMFLSDSTSLQAKYKDIYAEFFPMYINFLLSDSIRDYIEEVRIEGHTDIKGTYFHNMKLSQDRARNVLNFCYDLTENEKHRQWIQEHFTANGLSYSKPIYDSNNIIDLDRSRRVEFRIVPKAEKQIELIKKELIKINAKQ